MSTHDVDVVVLGGGSGGYAAAIRARELGKTVALIEEDKVGGTCLHRGCVPTKALLHAAEVADEVRDASRIGVLSRLEGIDAERVQAFRAGIVDKKYKGLQGLLRAHDIEIVSGRGTLTPDHSVRVGDDEFRGRDVVLATGATSRVPPGIDRGGRVLTSEDAVRLDVIPESIIVLGGGVIGVEFASLWRSFGVEVTIVEALAHLIPAEDASAVAALERAFRRRGIRSALGRRVEGVQQTADAVSATLDDGSVLTADFLLVAVGRGPVTADLGLEEAGVRLDRGFVVVDDALRTTASHVWAVGDIVPGLQLAHRAFQQGIFVAERIAGLDPTVVPDRSIPRITYSDPEVASVGLTQAQAEEEFGADTVQVAEVNLATNARSEILGTAGFVKVVRRTDGPVVGVHMVGARVGELVGEAQIIVGWEAHPEDVAPHIHAHPTQSEALGEAMLALAGRPLHTL